MIGVRAKKPFLTAITAAAILTLSLFFISSSALAQDPSTGGLVPCGVTTPCTLCHFVIGVHKLVLWGMYVVMGLAMLALVLTGIIYIFSSGNEGLMTTAKGFLKGILIGFAVILGGWLIITGTLQILSARGDLGIGKTDGWSNFTCNTASSALVPPPAPAGPDINATPGGGLQPGTANGPCGTNLVGRCSPLSCGSNQTWMTGGTSCSTGYYCCVDKIPVGGTCFANSAYGNRQGRCENLTGTGGATSLWNICPNRSLVMQQDATVTPTCDYDNHQGCCDSTAPPASAILDAPCGPPGSGATCQRGTLTSWCPAGTSHVTGGTDCDASNLLFCCGTSTGTSETLPGPEPIPGMQG